MNSLRARISYRFDILMSKGPTVLIGLLALVTVAFAVVMALLVVAFSSYPVSGEGFGEVLWVILLHALDAGSVVGAGGGAYATLMLLTSLGGLILLAGLIAVVSGALSGKIAQLRKGRGRVLETDHTLILGWNSRVFSMISEIVEANRSRKKSAIVILANGDKVEFEDAILERVGKTPRTRVIVRSGDPMTLADLAMVNHAAARSIIILAGDESQNADLVTMKTAMAVLNQPSASPAGHHVVAEIKEPENLDRVKLVSNSEVEWIVAGDVMSRVMVQTARQSGLSQIFLELLNFNGDEIYFTKQEKLVGRTFLEAAHLFSNSSLIGVFRSGEVVLNPASTMKIKAEDELIVIAPDDSMIKTSEVFTVDQSVLAPLKTISKKPEQILILGRNENLRLILTEINQYVAKGSAVSVVTTKPNAQPKNLSKLKLNFVSGDPTDRKVLDALKVASFDHIIVLADRDLPARESDALTIITLLQLRAISNDLGKSFNIVSEMLDDNNRQLAEITEADDFIVSDQIIGLLMSQISENRDLAAVFSELFSSDGSEISLQPAERYVKLGQTVDMHALIEAAARRGETALGYRKAALESSQQNGYGVALNPEKIRRFQLVEGDKVIVLAEG